MEVTRELLLGAVSLIFALWELFPIALFGLILSLLSEFVSCVYMASLELPGSHLNVLLFLM